MAGIDVKGASAAELEALEEQGISSIFLRGRSQLSVKQTAAVVKKAVDRLGPALPADLEPWVATDQEGGYVQTLQGPGFTRLPTALKQGQWPAAQLDAEISQAGAELAAAGINVDLAPVADVVPQAVGTSNAPIGYFGRQFGADPQAVSTAVTAVNQALLGAGVQPVVKHFPGLGRVRGNTDVDSSVDDSKIDADSSDLDPFRAAMSTQQPWIMMSNARYTKLDAQNDAPFSRKIITGLLRGQLGFENIVISDDLCEAEQVASVPLGQRAVKFIKAGGTMPLCVTASKAAAMAQAMAAEAGKDADFARQLQDAAVLVLQAKLEHGH